MHLRRSRRQRQEDGAVRGPRSRLMSISAITLTFSGLQLVPFRTIRGNVPVPAMLVERRRGQLDVVSFILDAPARASAGDEHAKAELSAAGVSSSCSASTRPYRSGCRSRRHPFLMKYLG
jgi:hypothetical protein